MSETVTPGRGTVRAFRSNGEKEEVLPQSFVDFAPPRACAHCYRFPKKVGVGPSLLIGGIFMRCMTGGHTELIVELSIEYGGADWTLVFCIQGLVSEFFFSFVGKGLSVCQRFQKHC